MDAILGLSVLSIAMLLGCYIAGSIPLAVSMSEARMEVVTVLGAGLLVGTALSVIIPEGVNTLLSATLLKHNVNTRKSPSESSGSKDANLVIAEELAVSEHGQLASHNIIGVSLVLGFLLMLLIDQCAGGHYKSDAEGGTTRGRKVPITATLGLVVHAAADGIALGAAAATSHTDVEVIVFLAIMLHKAPAAFGLVTFLLHEGLEKSRIKRHLLVFALAAPVGAAITYLIIVQSGTETLSSEKSTGIAMLFSAGTFLYVSTVHVLPELTSHHSETGGGSGQFSCKQLVALTCGSLLPLLLTFGHQH